MGAYWVNHSWKRKIFNTKTIKKRRVKRFVIPSHIILRQFRCAGCRGCKQFSSSSTNSASDSHAILTNVTSGFEVCSLCVWPASVTEECALTLSAQRHSLTRSYRPINPHAQNNCTHRCMLAIKIRNVTLIKLRSRHPDTISI